MARQFVTMVAEPGVFGCQWKYRGSVESGRATMRVEDGEDWSARTVAPWPPEGIGQRGGVRFNSRQGVSTVTP